MHFSLCTAPASPPLRVSPLRVLRTALYLLSVFQALAADLSFSDPARLSPPPAHAIGFPDRSPTLDVLPGFRSPPPGYGEVAFYWWVGDPLTRERLTWQLDQLDLAKGVMGLQVNYAHSDRGGRSYGLTLPSDPPLFSESWWDLFRWFMAEGKKRGMAASLSDYTLCAPGQGQWTDEIIRENPQMAGALLRSKSREAAGETDLSWDLSEPPLSVMGYRLGSSGPDPLEALDLRPNVTGSTLRWRPPAGRWKVVAVTAQRQPLSIDPMHPMSGRKYLEKFFQRFEDRCPGEGGRGLNFFFSDELDLGIHGRMWNAQFADEFRRRKGYDLVPELPALFEDVGPHTPKVRLDFSDVLVALSEEHFFRPIFEWHYSRGMIFGCDHGGRGRDVVEFGDYFRTQRWMTGPGCDQPHLGADVIKNKVASSIAHLYERPRTWLEGYYGSGWGTSTEQLTDATFRNFAMGQNLLTLHGLYYSTHGGWWEWAPPCNHFRMPYWPHMREFLGCVQRLSYLLSQGTHRCDVAIVYPVAPTEAGLGGPESVQAAFGLGDHLYQQGIDFDFIDFESVSRAQIENRELRVAGERYRVLVLPAMRAVRYSTLQKAAEFVRGGGIVLAIGALPEASDRAGRNDPELDALVRQTFGVTAAEARTATAAPGLKQLGNGLGAALRSNGEVASAIVGAFPRDFESHADPAKRSRPAVMHRQIGTRDLFMVYGLPRGTECSFRASGAVELWDPWTGSTRPLSAVVQTPERTRLRLPLSEKEAQLIVFRPGKAAIELPEPSTTPPARFVELDGDWEFEVKPTLDNRFGDFRWPPTAGLIGPEARQFRYADETTPNPGWEAPSVDDSKWTRTTAGFGPQFWKLGPLPEKADTAALEARLTALKAIDPAAPIEADGVQYRWQPYTFSWRWGIENDPGHQGYHGLKEAVHDEFIGLGNLRQDATGTRYEKEEGGSRYYLWTSVAESTGVDAHAASGGLKPAAAWLNRARLGPLPAKVQLNPGANPLLIRYDSPGRGYFVLDTSLRFGSQNAAAPATATPPPGAVSPLAMTWHEQGSVLPFDVRPQEAKPAGWYRFQAPPGLRALTIVARGQLSAWADGRPLSIASRRQRDDGAFEFKAVCAPPTAGPVKVALRLEQQRGFYAGAALPEPIALDCAPGVLPLGDWARIDGLACYSGGAWYRKTLTLTREQIQGRLELDLGSVVSSAEVRVNGRPAGIRVAPPWTFDVTALVRPGSNRFEVLVYGTLGNHYITIPTRYRGSTTAGLLGPVRLRVVPGTVNTALIPAPKLEEDSYDWYARHDEVLRLLKTTDPEIVLVGDSITHFWGGEPRAAIANGPKAWKQLFGSRRVLNLGFGWDRIQNVLWRLDHGELNGARPKLIVLHIGTNNTSDTQNARANQPAEIAEGIREICRRLRQIAPQARLLVMGVFPRGENANHPLRATIAEINRLLAPVGSEPGIHFVDIGSQFLASDGRITRDVMPDFLHPGEKGYAIWAEAIRAEMKELNLAN